MLDLNKTPVNDFDGFSHMQMELIIYSPFENECPIKINLLEKELLLKESPILKIIVELLSLIGEKGIKLTANGNLPLKVIKDIYSKNYFKDEFIENDITKISSEIDWTILHNVKLVLTLAGITKKQHSRLSLTKKGKLLLQKEDYSEIFILFLKAYTLKFLWAYNDRFPNQVIGQFAFLYSLYQLNKHGDVERDLAFYVDCYAKAFPKLMIKEEKTSLRYTFSESTYHIRFISRFAQWFGFCEEKIKKGNNYTELEIKIKKTRLLDMLLSVSMLDASIEKYQIYN